MDNRSELIDKLVRQWLKIAERDLMTAGRKGLEAKTDITDTACFHCQQAV